MKTRAPSFVERRLLPIALLPACLPAACLAACFLASPTRASAQEPDKPAPKTAHAGADASQDEAPQVDWRTDREAARKDAEKADKPILYYFRCDP